MELTWRTSDGEYEARYVARAASIEPRYLRTLRTNTFLGGAVIGFLSGVLAGRAIRRRWLPRPGPIAAVPPK